MSIIRGSLRQWRDHPNSTLLIVEVAETSLDYDLGDKAGLYAAHGIADYWVVSLSQRAV